MAKIILTGGGTAGHCAPNLALIPYLKEKFDNIYYVGSYNGIEQGMVSKTDIPYYPITCAKLRRSFTLKNITIPFSVIKGIKQAEKIIDEIRPDIIFSKGGYVAIPTVIAGYKRKIPIISHESDFSAGLANKISAKFSKIVLTTFPETVKEFNNAKYVGSPIKKEIFSSNKKECLKKFGFSNDKPVLLITGGSQGSKAINSTIHENIEQITASYNVIHLCGKGNLFREKTPKNYFQAEFINDMEKALIACDICVSRAGANTLFELLALKKPCVLIPLPKGNSRGDQVQNAEYFQRKGLVSVLPQSVLSSKTLLNQINLTYSNRFNIAKNFEQYKDFDASKKIVDIICSYIKP